MPLQQIGNISKTHGYNGVLVLISDQPLDENMENLREVFVMVDGLSVPFPVEGFTLRGDTSAHLKLEFIDTCEKAAMLLGSEVYADVMIEEQDAGLEQWIGFSVHDTTYGDIGTIRQIEDFKGNIVLQVISDNGRETLISLYPELIEKIEADTIHICAPEGYFE